MTPQIVSVAGVPLCDIDGQCVWHVWCLVILTVLDCAWDSWHVRSGLAVMLPICLRDIAAFDTVAGVAHGDIDAAFLWLRGTCWHWLCLLLCGRCGMNELGWLWVCTFVCLTLRVLSVAGGSFSGSRPRLCMRVWVSRLHVHLGLVCARSRLAGAKFPAPVNENDVSVQLVGHRQGLCFVCARSRLVCACSRLVCARFLCLFFLSSVTVNFTQCPVLKSCQALFWPLSGPNPSKRTSPAVLWFLGSFLCGLLCSFLSLAARVLQYGHQISRERGCGSTCGRVVGWSFAFFVFKGSTSRAGSDSFACCPCCATLSWAVVKDSGQVWTSVNSNSQEGPWVWQVGCAFYFAVWKRSQEFLLPLKTMSPTPFILPQDCLSNCHPFTFPCWVFDCDAFYGECLSLVYDRRVMFLSGAQLPKARDVRIPSTPASLKGWKEHVTDPHSTEM